MSDEDRKDAKPIEGEPASGKKKEWLRELLELRLAGAHLADGTDPDEHVRQIRVGWAETDEAADHHDAVTTEPRKHLQALIDAKGIGIEMARGIDLDEHLRQVREGWDEEPE